MHIYSKVKQDIINIINKLIENKILAKVSYESLTVEPPKNPEHGEISTNAAMIIASQLNKNPREIAGQIAEYLLQLNYVKTVAIAGAGFINLVLHQKLWQSEISKILKLGVNYGDSDMGGGKKVNLEFVSTNPTGPMHIGHTRGAVFGDALAALLAKCNYKVSKEYYINDAGNQIYILIESVYLRYREVCGEEGIVIPEGLYPGEYIKDVAKKVKDSYGDRFLHQDQEQFFFIFKEIALDYIMGLIKSDLKDLGVEHDTFFSESSLHESGKIQQVIERLSKKDLIYEGVLEQPKGKVIENWEPTIQTLFKAKMLGDDSDRVIQKSDGSYTYFAADIAYCADKIERGYDSLIFVLGADHGGYIKRIKAVVQALNDQVEVDVKITQLVNLLKNGIQFKMSKRAGNFITVRDVIDAVGKDVTRFMMLTRKNDIVLDFDLDKVKEQSNDNPVFYVQYAHARAQSILRNAAIDMPDLLQTIGNFDDLHLNLLNSEEELKLIRLLSLWPRVVEQSAIQHEPHRIVFYLMDLAGEFHSFWAKGRENKQLKFIIITNPELTLARLTLVKAIIFVINSALSVLNIEAVEEM